jgi:alkylhydroperoxidase/carboxymuconolactone decarboxylase family protein YurZ
MTSTQTGSTELDDLYGRIWQKRELPDRDQHLVAIIASTHMRSKQLATTFVRSALQQELLTGDELQEVMLAGAVYLGFPAIGTVLRPAMTEAARDLGLTLGDPLLLSDPARRHDLPPWHYSEREDLLSSRPEMAPFWGRIVVWTANFGAPKAANIRRVGISFDVRGDDDFVREAGRRVAEAMSTWWAVVSAWIEVLHSQDLSRLGPVEPGIKFGGTTLWSRLYSLQGHPIPGGHILPVGSSAFSVAWPNYTSIGAQQLQRCIDHSQRHGPPSTEWMLIRDANSLCAGQDYRRSVLDAGLAAELAVTKLIRTHLAAAGHPNIDGELRANSMLGRLRGYWVQKCGGTLPANYQTRLIDRRNAATHAGAHLPESDVRDAISVARDILNQATPLPP